MQDLMMDIFILCMIANEQGPEEYTHDYFKNWMGVFRHRKGCESVYKTVCNVSDALELKNYLEAITNGGEGDESIWE